MHGNNKFKHISRIDAKHNHCWFVRIAYNKKMYRKSFSDKNNGGRYSALLNALLWRDRTLQQLDKPLSPRTIQVVKSKTNTGITGIRETVYKERKFRSGEYREYSYPVFEITYFPKPNLVKRDRVFINKHGRKKALKIAISKNKAYREAAAEFGVSRYPGIPLKQ